MLRTRVMPCLLLSEGGLVKTVNFKKPRYVGDPINAVRIFNEKEVDELILLDINASSDGAGINFSLIEDIVSESFMPIAYGGGVRSVSDFRRLFALGVEKVSINTAALENPKLITEASKVFGSQSVIVTMDVKKTFLRKKNLVWNRSNASKNKMSPVEYAQKIESLGAGEIIINSVDREGTWDGFDVELVQSITEAVNIPVVACGGAGELAHVEEVVNRGGASAVALGSMSVFQGKDLGVLIKFPTQQQLKETLK